MATSPYERMRTVVERLNMQDRGLPDRKSSNVSSFQQWAVRALMEWNALGKPADVQTIHGDHALELARVLEAFALLLRNRASGFRTF
jgi:hypothetical protein